MNSRLCTCIGSFSFASLLTFIALQLIGTPSEAELEFLNENAKRYIRQLPLYRRQSLTEKFPNVHPSAIDLVEKMLTFDPRRRLTGENLMNYKDFPCTDGYEYLN